MRLPHPTPRALRLTAGILLIGLGIGALVLTLTADPTDPRDYTAHCTRAHIHTPDRLRFIGCETVTGVVETINRDFDGDYHAFVRLDPPYRHLLTEGNLRYSRGDMVVEDVCHYRTIQPDAILSCRGYRSPFPLPAKGGHYLFRGNYVIDMGHHKNWAEIHGLSDFRDISELPFVP